MANSISMSFNKNYKFFMWIFDWRDFSIKDIVELEGDELEIVEDEETNAASNVSSNKDSKATSNDIVVIKKNGEIVYWGIINEVQNKNGNSKYVYVLKYITNIFDQNCTMNSLKMTNLYNRNTAIDKYIGPNGELMNPDLYNMTSDFISVTPDNYYTFLLLTGDDSIEPWSRCAWYNSNKQFISTFCYSVGDYNYSKTLKSPSNARYARLSARYQQDEHISSAMSFYHEDINIPSAYLVNIIGIEDYLAALIKENFINNDDSFINRTYLKVNVLSHTPININDFINTVLYENNGIMNLHTFMTNCTQLYNIAYNFYIEDNKLNIDISNITKTKQLIDTSAQNITEYSEVFETDIVSKVVVLTDTSPYYLYLLNDRTTTTDQTNPNRANGKTEFTYTEKIDDAPQVALDIIKGNSYNHNVSFCYDKYLSVGTPITIKTKNQIVYDTYISKVTIDNKKFFSYECGNIRINLIEKLLKEK